MLPAMGAQVKVESGPGPGTSDESAPSPPRLLDRLRHAIRVRHFAIRTEQTYVDWARRFVLFHGKRHPQEMSAAEVEAFLTHLAVERGAVSLPAPPWPSPRRAARLHPWA